MIHNPHNVTQEQLDPDGEGYRFLTVAEVEEGATMEYCEEVSVDAWEDGNECWESGYGGGHWGLTYRTLFPVSELHALRVNASLVNYPEILDIP